MCASCRPITLTRICHPRHSHNPAATCIGYACTARTSGLSSQKGRHSPVLNIDWQQLFTSDTPLLEIVIRGTVMYLGLFVILRIIMKREAGTIGISDLLVVVLLADAAQNGMAGDYHSITDGLLLVLTIVAWSYVLDWVSYRFPRFRHLIQPAAIPLIKDGQLLRRNMRKELISEEELRGLVRQHGLEDFSNIRRAYLEEDGRLSVIQKEKPQQDQGNEKRTGV
ncbi:MAG: DUF421 domain-containing protein [Anaerolineae bacterium]|nr:DUF421 domain-containing protein [Anaerolineae bacterium]